MRHLPLSVTERDCSHHQRSGYEPCITLASRRAYGAMVSARQRASKAAAALGLAAGASLCSNHGVGAFYIPLVFAPRQISRVTRSAEGVQPTASFSTAGRGHRFYVRERAGSEVQLGLGSRRDSVLGRARGLGEGSRKGSRLWMLVDEDATSVSVWVVRGLSKVRATWLGFVHNFTAVGSGPPAQEFALLRSCTSTWQAALVYLPGTRAYIEVVILTRSQNQSSSWCWQALCPRFLFHE